MNFSTLLQQGELIKRYKRFLIDIKCADGSVITAHCPNSGSMMGLKEPGLQVAYSVSDNPNRKLPYTLEMVQIGKTWVGVNTQWPNKIFQQAFINQQLDEFKDYSECKSEVKISKKTRLDFLLSSETEQRYVEVKNVTLQRDGYAEFPDAVTTRGAKHINTLMELVDEGFKASLVFIVQRDDCKIFSPAADIDPAYAGFLRKAVEKGVELQVYYCTVSPSKIEIMGQLPVEL
ncbi:MAG: DNA/RNA nuclease SfsA [Rickettsiales bacterium]|nr:DNA/RNA nuclease SfsA [Rickettsiales bacterium]|tara:strand:+ start:61001 stop:61696 length:696 start_codon:yes stop_codon:yes gene_type:complete